MVNFCFIQPPSSLLKKCKYCGIEFKPKRCDQITCLSKECIHLRYLDKWKRKREKHRKLINEDNMKRYYKRKESYQKETKECDCGCKKIIPKYTARGKPNKFYRGHYWKGRKMPNWVSEKWRERQLKLMSDSEYIQKRMKFLHARPNKLESRILSIIKENNIDLEYVGSGEFFIGRFNPDFINKEKKKVVEVFGEYWHKRDKALKKDEYRMDEYKKHGYDCMIMWEKGIKNQTDSQIVWFLDMFMSKPTIKEVMDASS